MGTDARYFLERIMKRFLFVLVLVVVGIGCLEFYMGWFRIGSDSGDGKAHITLTVDQRNSRLTRTKLWKTRQI
jgi:hypothetical protein